MKLVTTISAKTPDITSALGTFSQETINLLNQFVGGIVGLLAAAAIVYIVVWAIKRNSKPEIAEEANRRIKTAVITLIIIVLAATAGFTLINAVLAKVADSPFDVSALLQW